MRLRLLALTSLLLAVGFALVVGVIDRSFSAALESAERDMLDSQIITLLAVAEPNDSSSLRLPYDMPDARLNTPGSGLYAFVKDASGTVIWQSRSAIGIDFEPALVLPAAGERRIDVQSSSRGERLQALSLGVVWQFDSVINTDSAYFALTVSESRASLEDQLASFRGTLYLAFAAVALMILVAIGLLLGWLLRPLGQIASEIEAVEKGESQALSQDYPSELTGVARNLNTLLASELKRSERYQQTLANLAHSLKTPLAAARSLVDDARAERRTEQLRDQLQRMTDIVRYQLARPAATSQRVGRGAVDVHPLAIDLLDGLDKVYRDKHVSAECDIDASLRFAVEQGDLAEILGNLLDNAYKWSATALLLTIALDEPQDAPARLRITVDDDGPGFPKGDAARALDRGTRLDETQPGTGIGLAVVKEIAALYRGDVSIATSPMGGARLQVTLHAG
ncbi:MAG: ATP-binding protein [Pseudomonadota bacterium]